jgi:hypothetical protein
VIEESRGQKVVLASGSPGGALVVEVDDPVTVGEKVFQCRNPDVLDVESFEV